MTVAGVPSASFAENGVAAGAAPLSICSQPAMLTAVAPLLYSSIASPTTGEGVASALSEEISLMWTFAQSGVSAWTAAGSAIASAPAMTVAERIATIREMG